MVDTATKQNTLWPIFSQRKLKSCRSYVFLLFTVGQRICMDLLLKIFTFAYPEPNYTSRENLYPFELLFLSNIP